MFNNSDLVNFIVAPTKAQLHTYLKFLPITGEILSLPPPTKKQIQDDI